MPGQKLIAKIITIALFSVLIFSFAIWGIGDIFMGGGQQQIVAEVGDQEIDQQTFARAFSRELNQVSRRFGNQIDRDQARLLGLDQQVLGGLINRALLEEQAADLELVVTEAQIKERIIAEPAFRDEFGNFDRNRFVQGLYNAGITEASYVQQLKEETRNRQLTGAVIDAVSAPASLVEEFYAYQQERRVADYIVVPTVEAEAVAEPEEESLRSFYDDRGNSFMAPEYRGVTLVNIRPEEVADEIAVSEGELQEAFEARREDFVVPELRNLEQIVFSDEAEALAAYERLQAGEEFVVVAVSVTGSPPVDLGKSAKGDLLGPLGEAAFALEGASFTAPVESSLGWHILRVMNIEPGSEPVFEEVRDVLHDQLAREKAVDSIIALANRFDDELGGGASLEDAAAALALTVQRIPEVDNAGLDASGSAVEDLPPLAAFSRTLFDTQEGATSLLTETNDGGHFVLRVDAVRPAARRPFGEVRAQVEALWRESERLKLTGARAEALVDALANEVPIAEVAEQNGLDLKESAALTRDERAPNRTPARQLAGALFQMDPGEVSALPTLSGYIVAQLKEIQPADRSTDEAGFNAAGQNLANALKADFLDLYMSALTIQYGVDINQRLLEQTLNAY